MCLFPWKKKKILTGRYGRDGGVDGDLQEDWARGLFLGLLLLGSPSPWWAAANPRLRRRSSSTRRYYLALTKQSCLDWDSRKQHKICEKSLVLYVPSRANGQGSPGYSSSWSKTERQMTAGPDPPMPSPCGCQDGATTWLSVTTRAFTPKSEPHLNAF